MAWQSDNYRIIPRYKDTSRLDDHRIILGDSNVAFLRKKI